MFHPHDGISYRAVNSRGGPALARAAGKRWIDIDSQACRRADGTMVAVAAHWPRVSDEFDVKAAGLPDDIRWHQTQCSSVKALRGKAPDRVQAEFMLAMVEAAAQAGLTGIEWEIKPGVGAFLKAGPYRPVLARAQELGVQVVVKTLVDFDPAYAWRRLAAAKRAGATTMLLNHGDEPVVITPEREMYTDYVRGGWRRGR